MMDTYSDPDIKTDTFCYDCEYRQHILITFDDEIPIYIELIASIGASGQSRVPG